MPQRLLEWAHQITISYCLLKFREPHADTSQVQLAQLSIYDSLDVSYVLRAISNRFMDNQVLG
jgi:hypothetical protein